MDRRSEAEDRALDTRCRLPSSPASRNAVVRLRALPPASQALCLMNYAVCDLPHLVRCALEAVCHCCGAGSSASVSLPAGALFAQGISADTRCGEGDAPMLCFAAQLGSERALQALLDGRANHVLADLKGWTAAHHSAEYGRTNCLRLLIDAGAQLEAKALRGFTPLLLAAQHGHAECCTLLLAMGSDANARTDYGETPLIQAITFEHSQCVRILLPASDLSVTMHQGRNAFHACIGKGNLECFELLLPLISDVDVGTVAGVEADGSPSPSNVTPLHLACSFGQERMVRALLDRGASRTSRDSDHCTPLHHASLPGHLGCVRQLLGKPGAYKLTPAEVNAADADGATPLHYAAKGGHTKICGMLRTGGARLDAVTRDGHTPLTAAQLFHPSNTALIDLLAGRGPAHPPGTVCDECGRPEPEVYLRSCTGCLRARFCGNACLRAAWPAHRAECQRIQAAREERTRGMTIDV